MFAEAVERLPSRPAQTTKDEFRDRQGRLTSQFRHDDLLIIASPPFAVRSNDVGYRYRTSSDLLYLTGWIEPESVFVIRHDGKAWISSLFVQPQDTLKEIWEGRRPGVKGAVSDYAVDEAYNNDELEEKLEEWLTDAHRVFHRSGVHGGLDRLVESSVQRRDRARQHFGTGPVAIQDPSGLLAELRLRKSSSEIEQMAVSYTHLTLPTKA